MIDIFRIGVHIGMTSNAGQVLGVMLRHLTGVHHSVNQINSQFKTMALLAGGAMTAIGGVAALRGIWGVIEASRKLNDELTRTKQLGGQFAATVDQSRAAAFGTAVAVPTFAPSDLVRVQRELGTQMQNPEEAAKVLPMAAKTAAVVSHYTGEDQETIIKNLIKIVDLRAKLFTMGADGKEHIDPSKLGPELEAAAKGLILGGNYIKSSDLLQMAKQAGVPVKTMSQEAFYAAMMEMGISQGASRAGTATTSLFSQLVGSTMPLHTAVEMQKMGMMSGDEWHKERGGKVVVGDAATHRFQEALKDPIAYITGPLNDLLTKKGMDSNQKLMEVFRLFGRQTTQRLVAEALSAAPQFERARAMFGDIPGVDKQFSTLMNENLTTNINATTAAWHGFMESLGDAGVPAAITMLHGITTALHALTALSEAHPNIAAWLLGLSAALATLAAVGGSITVITIGLRGLIPIFTGVAAVANITGISTLGASLTAAAGGIAALAGGIAALAAPIAAIMGILKIGSDAETPENRAHLEQLRRDRGGGMMPTPNDGFGPDGSPVRRESMVPPARSPAGGDGGPIPVHVVNGRDIADGTAKHIGNQASRPAAGPSGFDGSMNLLQPGFSAP